LGSGGEGGVNSAVAAVGADRGSAGRTRRRVGVPTLKRQKKSWREDILPRGGKPKEVKGVNLRCSN